MCNGLVGLGRAAVALAAASFVGCAGATGGPRELAPGASSSGRGCRTGAASDSPLVTEWPAPEKAHLEALATSQAVAVAFSGCELRVIDGCKPSGRYAWRRTTLATDTIEMVTGDELWAKLPLGAVRLEGELARTGRLAVRTTVAGQLALGGYDPASVAAQDSCRDVTHVVASISVGAFGLVSGGAVTARGGGGVMGIGAGAGARRDEEIVRRAGEPGSCGAARDDGPNPACGAPIQLFLLPVRGPDVAASAARTHDAPAVVVTFPAPEDRREHWTLHDVSGALLCELPCTRPIAPGSGTYLERSAAGGHDLARVELPARLPHAAHSHAMASYRAERGQPFWSALAFYGVGLPAAVGGSILLGLAAGGTFKDDEPGGRDRTGFAVTASAMYLGVAGATLGWWLWSHPAGFETRAAVRVGPTGVSGSF